MRKGIKFLATLLVLLLSIHLAVSLIVADSKGINNLSKLEIIQKTQKIQVPFIANRGQIDRNVKFYANTFWGSVFINNDGEIIYSLPKITSDKLGIQSLDNKGESDTFHYPDPDSFKNYDPAKVINLYSTIKNSSPTLVGNQKSIALFLKEEFIGGKISSIEGEEKSITNVNYFNGNDPSKWESNIFTYELVNLGEVYKGIELKLKAYGNNIEKLFYIKPGAVPESIQIKLKGANALKVNEKGQLEVETALGIVTFTKPIAYQEIEGKRLEVPVEYILLNAKQNASQLLTSASSTSDSSTINSLTPPFIYGFKIASYDKTKVVVIDPLLASTYLGGMHEDDGFSIASDSSGNVYIVGLTKGDNFTTTSGAFDISYNGGRYSNTSGDAFISKLNKDLTKLLASTYLGGSGKDSARSIVIDSDGNIYVSGQTESSDFPTTSNAYDSSYNGGGGDQFNKGEGGDVFISKLNNDLSKLLASTYLGGTRGDNSYSIAKDKGGNIYLTGVTKSSNFPTTPNAYIQNLIGDSDVFISKLSADLSRLLASTYLGGSDSDISCSMFFCSDGSIYVAGQTESSDFPTVPNNYDISYNGNTDAFVSKLSDDLTKLLASTYLGGSSGDGCRSIAIDSNGNIYVTGWTVSPNFPSTSNAYDNSFNGKEDVFVSKLSNDLTKLLASTYLGGSSVDAGYSMTVDSNGNIYLTGPTASSNFPTTSNAYDNSFNGGKDVFVSKLSNDLIKLLASTYLGGSEEDEGNFLTINSDGNVHVTGWTRSSDFPITTKAYDSSLGGSIYGDAFILNFDDTLSVSPPIVMTGTAKILTPNSAKLNGLVNANDSSTKVWFEYGTKKGSYNNTSSTQTIVGSNDTKVSIGISGLSVGTTYYYRIVAQNNVGTMYGNEKTFIQEIQSPQSSSIPSASEPQPPYQDLPFPQRYVEDMVNIISDTVEKDLNGYLHELEQKTGTQMIVLTINTTGSVTIETHAIELATKWKLGQKGKDNGVLVIIAKDDRAYRIEIGRGLEKILPDSFCGTVGRTYFVPNFQKGQFTDGIYQGVVVIGDKIAEDFKQTPYTASTKKDRQDLMPEIPAPQGRRTNLTLAKLTEGIEDAEHFDNKSQVFPYKYDDVWSAVEYVLEDQKEKVIQSDKETGIVVTDTCRWAMNRKYYKYYILVERENDISSKLNLKLLAHDSVWNKNLKKSFLEPMNKSHVNKKVKIFLESVKKRLEKNK